jgi:hypothetical protein
MSSLLSYLEAGDLAAVPEMSTTGTIKLERKRRKEKDGALRWILAILSIGVAGYAVVRYVFFPPAAGHFSERLLLLQVHASAGALALLTGPWQFWRRFRERYYGAHRWLGRVYLVAVGVGAPAACGLAFFSEEGWPTHVGFGLLAVLWFATGWMAYSAARQSRFRQHREWAMRNFALTFAAVTLRNELPLLLLAAHLSFHAAYITVAWLCWIPNVAVAEWWLRRRASYT